MKHHYQLIGIITKTWHCFPSTSSILEKILIYHFCSELRTYLTTNKEIRLIMEYHFQYQLPLPISTIKTVGETNMTKSNSRKTKVQDIPLPISTTNGWAGLQKAEFQSVLNGYACTKNQMDNIITVLDKAGDFSVLDFSPKWVIDLS